MKRLLYALLLLMAAGINAEAQHPMRHWLTSMPDSVMPLLTKNNRLDLIDFFDAHMEATVTNRVDGKSRMDTLTADFAHIRYTQSADVAMKLVPIDDTTHILCMVTTVKAAVADSRIAFFDAAWAPLDAATYIAQPRMEEFRAAVQDDSARWAWSKMDIFFRTYRLCAGSTELECVITTPDYLSKEDRTEVMPYLRQEPLIYRWNDGKYQRYE